MIRNSRRTSSRCKFYRPIEGDFSLSGVSENCGSCIYFSSKNCHKHSLDEIPDFYEQP